MTRSIGKTDTGIYESPNPALLRRATGLEPEPAGTHVMLDAFGIRSAQRLALADIGGGIVVAFWPAELKPQAEFLYSEGRGQAMVAAGQEHRWEVCDPAAGLLHGGPVEAALHGARHRSCRVRTTLGGS